MLTVVATNKEKEYAEKLGYQNIKVIGIGGVNVVKNMQSVPRDTPILNFGFCGAWGIEKGTFCKIGRCETFHPNAGDISEQEYWLSGDTICFTASDFVTSTPYDFPAVYDMELAFILALGFINVAAVKVVSDNLNYEEYIKSTEDLIK